MSYKKDYLNSTELMQVMFLDALSLNLSEIIDSWGKRKVIDETDSERLREAKIIINNFLSKTLSSLDKKERIKYEKKYNTNTVCMYDVHEINKLEARKNNSQKNCHIFYDEFCDLCEEIMDIRCNKCTEHWSNCSLYKILDENNAPESGFLFGKCKYAYFL